MNQNKIKIPRKRMLALFWILGTLPIAVAVFYHSSLLYLDYCACSTGRRAEGLLTTAEQAARIISYASALVSAGLIIAIPILLASIIISVFVQFRKRRRNRDRSNCI